MLKGVFFVFGGACSFGILSTIVKFAYADGFSLGDITASQALLGMLFLWILYGIVPLSKSQQVDKTSDPTSSTAWWKVYLSGFSSGLVSVLYYKCVNMLPASIAIILLMQYLWISVLLEFVIYKKKPSTIESIAVVLALLGTCMAGGLLSNKLADLDPAGLLFGLLSALAYAVFLLANGKIGNDLPPLKKSALMITGACTMIFIVFPPTFLFRLDILAGLWIWALPLALFGTTIPPVMFAIGIPKAGVTVSAVVSAVELPVAVGMSYFVLHEAVDVWQFFGVIVMLCAIVLPNLIRNPKG